ncbi:hypothetical protein B0H16DRAFT_1749541 [Mycena metata]|uniref:Uncharacterized protein n=1 Tax=Mycena metata TaxID=1033252 RepID=A0AAD7DSP4_9AGAR|nr:hypothetical protein B0H16DRAFT_1749541 [Mycena metata]
MTDYEEISDEEDGDEDSDMEPCGPIPIDEAVLRGIKDLFVEEFTRISHKFSVFGDGRSQPWPSEGQLAELIRRASDVWIYAQTVIRFVDERQCDPRTRLQLVLAHGGEITDALESLDALYSTIPSVHPPRPTLPAVIDIIRAAIGGINPEDIDDLMQLPSGTARCSLRGLSSLLIRPPIREGALRRVTPVHHSSFPNYLCDRGRAKEFWIYTKDADARMLDRTTHLLSIQDPLAQYREPFVQLLTRKLVAAEDIALAERLTQYTDDFRFVCNFEVAVWLEPAAGPPLPPQPKLDAIYLHLLSTHPPVLRFLRTVLAWQRILNLKHRVPLAMQVSGVSWLDLRPACLLRECVKIPFGLNESPVDFLLDPQRAGGLFRDPETLAQEASILIIQYLRAILGAGNRRPAKILNGFRKWAIVITSCRPSLTVFNELKTLDPLLFCKYAHADPKVHFKDHASCDVPSEQHFDAIIGWLQEFEPKPKEVIDFWVTRRTLASECRSRMKSYIQGSDMALVEKWEFIPGRVSSGEIRGEGEDWLTAEGELQ